jgi:hypothetical protein
MANNQSSRINTGVFTKGTDDVVSNTALDVSSALLDNPPFALVTVPPAQLLVLNTTFNDARIEGRKGGTDRTLAKSLARQAVIDALMQDALFCLGVARLNLPLLLTTGFPIVSRNRVSQPLATPTILGIDNSVKGQLLVRGSSVVNARMFQLQISLDHGVTWLNMGGYNGAQRMLLTPTVAGQLYLVQMAALGGSTGRSQWSNSFPMMSM